MTPLNKIPRAATVLDISILSRIKPFKCENRFLSGKLCIERPIFGVARF